MFFKNRRLISVFTPIFMNSDSFIHSDKLYFGIFTTLQKRNQNKTQFYKPIINQKMNRLKPGLPHIIHSLSSLMSSVVSILDIHDLSCVLHMLIHC